MHMGKCKRDQVTFIARSYIASILLEYPTLGPHCCRYERQNVFSLAFLLLEE